MDTDPSSNGQTLIEDLDEIYMAIRPFIEVLSQYDRRIDGKIAVMSFGEKKVTLDDLRRLDHAREKVFEVARGIVNMGAMKRADFLKVETAQWARPLHQSDFRDFVERDILGVGRESAPQEPNSWLEDFDPPTKTPKP